MADEQTNTDKLLSVLKSARRMAAKNILHKINEGKIPSAHEAKILEEIELELQGPQEDQASGEGGKAPAPSEFRNALAVSTWLKEDGWAIGKSRVYDHIKEGKLRPDLPDGGFSLKAVQKYASLHLTRSRTRQKLKDEEIQRRKLIAEIEKTEAEAKRAKLKLAVEEGRYVLMEDVERLFAGRAVLMDTMRQASIVNHAAKRVALVGGDPSKVADLIAMDMAQHNEDMNLFASSEEFSVILESTAGARLNGTLTAEGEAQETE